MNCDTYLTVEIVTSVITVIGAAGVMNVSRMSSVTNDTNTPGVTQVLVTHHISGRILEINNQLLLPLFDPALMVSDDCKNNLRETLKIFERDFVN